MISFGTNLVGNMVDIDAQVGIPLILFAIPGLA